MTPLSGLLPPLSGLIPPLPRELILVGGIAHLLILTASAMVPFRLKWRETLAPLPRLHRQMYVIYGGYIVLSIVTFSALSLVLSHEMAGGTPLARAVNGYIAVFWGVRVALQGVMDVGPYLSSGLDRLGYRGLTLIFLFLTLLHAWAALG
jgi:hypothetical protein